MTNLSALMTGVTVDSGIPLAASVDGDINRGRRALRRQTRRRVEATTLCATAVLGAVLAFSALPTAPGPQLQDPPIQLVRYSLPQPVGFTIKQVPDGWHVLRSTSSAMILGSASDDGTDLDAPVISFRQRIAVTLVSAESLPSASDTRPVPIDGTTVTISDSEGDGVLTVTVPQGNGRWLSIVIPEQLHFTTDQAAAFAAGLHSTADAALSHG